MLIFTISKKDLYWISLFLISYYGYIIAYNKTKNHNRGDSFFIYEYWIFIYKYLLFMLYYNINKAKLIIKPI